MPAEMASRLEQQEKEKQKKEFLKYDDAEKQQMRRIYQCLRDDWEQQNTPLDEFDGVSLRTACRQNRLAANSFLTPVLNDGEVRIVTGTTEGKLDSVFNTVFNQNIESEVRAYNEFDIEDFELGDSLTKLIFRTKQIERDEDFNESMLREILVMPAVFVQETMSDEWFYDRQLEEGDWEDLWQFKIPKFKETTWLRKREAKKVLWTCEQVFLADIKIPARLFHLQPHIITYRVRSYEDAESIYCNSPRWKYVHPGMPVNQEFKNDIETSQWRMSNKLQANQVEEIIYKSVSGDEMQVLLNGVNMLPVGCPYFTKGRFKTYDMTMEGMKQIHAKFAYFRPIVSMTKVMQALKDENFRLMILKYRQAIWKPIVTKAQTILSKDMWLPAAITYGINKSDIDVLIDDSEKSQGIDQSMNEMVEAEIEKFINISGLFQGLSEGQMTAHEVAQRMKQALIGLGAALTGYMKAIRNCDYLRLYNLIQNMTQPIDMRYNDYAKKSEDVFRSFTIDEVDLVDGKVGREIISFINRDLLPEEEQTVLEIEEKSRERGRPVDLTFLPVDKLLHVPYLFYITVVAKEKRSSLLEKEMFKKDMTDAVSFGRLIGASINPEYATQEWAKRSNLDAKKLYIVPQPGMQPMVNPMQPGQQEGEMPKPETMSMSGFGPKQMMDADAMGGSAS